MTASIRQLTPPPSPRSRGGTFEGLEKLFFDKAAAIEAGELTAPPEVLELSPRPWWAGWRTRPLYQKLGLAVAAAFLLFAALVMFGPRSKDSPRQEGHAQKPTPAPAVAAPAPAAVVVPPVAPAAMEASAPAALPVEPKQESASVTAIKREASASGAHAHRRRHGERPRARASEVKGKRHRAAQRRLRPLDPFD